LGWQDDTAQGGYQGRVATNSVLSDIVLFFCLAAFTVGIVLATASLLAAN
jgi:hypothetical protein